MRRGGASGRLSGSWRGGCRFPRRLAEQIIADRAQSREVVQRHVSVSGRGEVNEVILLVQFAHQLSLFDAVDTQIAFQIDVHFNHLFRIAGLFDNEGDQFRFQFFWRD